MKMHLGKFILKNSYFIDFWGGFLVPELLLVLRSSAGKSFQHPDMNFY